MIAVTSIAHCMSAARKGIDTDIPFMAAVRSDEAISSTGTRLKFGFLLMAAPSR